MGRGVGTWLGGAGLRTSEHWPAAVAACVVLRPIPTVRAAGTVLESTVSHLFCPALARSRNNSGGAGHVALGSPWPEMLLGGSRGARSGARWVVVVSPRYLQLLSGALKL